VSNLHLEQLERQTMKSRGMVMVGALVRTTGGIMKIVTAYKCEAKGEYIQFAGDGATMWSPLGDFEILSLDD
jgi:hypothetical protein